MTLQNHKHIIRPDFHPKRDFSLVIFIVAIYTIAFILRLLISSTIGWFAEAQLLLRPMLIFIPLTALRLKYRHSGSLRWWEILLLPTLMILHACALEFIPRIFGFTLHWNHNLPSKHFPEVPTMVAIRDFLATNIPFLARFVPGATAKNVPSIQPFFEGSAIKFALYVVCNLGYLIAIMIISSFLIKRIFKNKPGSQGHKKHG